MTVLLTTDVIGLDSLFLPPPTARNLMLLLKRMRQRYDNKYCLVLPTRLRVPTLVKLCKLPSPCRY